MIFCPEQNLIDCVMPPNLITQPLMLLVKSIVRVQMNFLQNKARILMLIDLHRPSIWLWLSKKNIRTVFMNNKIIVVLRSMFMGWEEFVYCDVPSDIFMVQTLWQLYKNEDFTRKTSLRSFVFEVMGFV